MIRNRLSTLMGERRMKITTLSKMTGISRTTLTELYYDRAEGMQFETLDRLCKALGCAVGDLIEYRKGVQ